MDSPKVENLDSAASGLVGSFWFLFGVFLRSPSAQGVRARAQRTAAGVGFGSEELAGWSHCFLLWHEMETPVRIPLPFWSVARGAWRGWGPRLELRADKGLGDFYRL